MARKKKSGEIPVEEANILPVMNIMFLLIPALLLAMEVASMAAIVVSPPKFAAAPPKEEQKKEEEKEKPLKLKVFIMDEGFRLQASGQQDGAEAGKEVDSSKPTIPNITSSPECLAGFQASGMVEFGKTLCKYDFQKLEAKAKEYKSRAEKEQVVTISAINPIPMQVLVQTMDAMRGSECKLLKAMKAGEEIPPECYFWQPIIEAGAG
jgi:biopolymer transport protein ExbD